ncbi:hypothetical protein CBS147321_10521 [Aspergillus niger]|nr:hypothetical protein CBS133816_3265 [Aspergillus niger]KAI2930395.1 hypothetical protein CBS147321_10521 [Aspergillus niger]KAI2959728.1 hypothetical protein CBS147324_10235 [Aspergillus niger]KAI2982914.1 hypothetical protein CBS147482_10123 [Aspergillus niger]KAI3055251.1 hypothetical protein CBS147352_3150 [Aspergillus niger]
MSIEEQMEAKAEFRSEEANLYYTAATGLYNDIHWRALKIPYLGMRHYLYQQTGYPWDGDVINFRAGLVAITTSHVWTMEEPNEWNESEELLTIIRNDLGIDPEGGTESANFEWASRRNLEYRLEMLRQAEEDERDICWRNWPFKDDTDFSSPPLDAESSEETVTVFIDQIIIEQESVSNMKIVHLKQPPSCIAIGYSGYICKADQNTIIKHPRYHPDNEPYNQMYRDMISTERQIYERLGSHKGIIPYLGVHDHSTSAIKLAYAQQGHLESYIHYHDMPSESIRASWIETIVETFWYIYSRNILHQDVKPNKILVHDDSPKVSDFGNPEIFALDANMEAIYMKDSFSRVDILGIGCIIYSIAAWRTFWYDYFEQDRWPESKDLPVISGLLYEDIVRKCWSDCYENMQSLYEDFSAVTSTDMSSAEEG